VINWSTLIAKFVSTCMSWIEAGNLRNRCFKMAEESEIMMTALEDIERMSKEANIKRYARKAIETVKGLPVEDYR